MSHYGRDIITVEQGCQGHVLPDKAGPVAVGSRVGRASIASGCPPPRNCKGVEPWVQNGRIPSSPPKRRPQITTVSRVEAISTLRLRSAQKPRQ